MTVDFSSPYTIPLTVATYDCDVNRRIKPSSVLRLQQEIGELHLATVGMGYKALCDMGLVFLLTRTLCTVCDAPRLEDEILLSTTSHGVKGVNFIRSYDFTAPDGRALIHSVTAFVLVDPAEHKILRPTAADRFGMVHCPVMPPELPGRVSLPAAASAEEPRTVRFTDIDYNGHLNNTVYADIVMDYVPAELANRPLRRFEINFSGEAKLGDKLSVTSYTEGGVFLLGAEHASGRCFTARFEF